MAAYDNAALNNITIDIKWDMDALEARYATGVIFQRVLNKSQNVKKSGLRVSIPIEPVYSSGTVTQATGAFTPAATAPTQANIDLNIWSYVATELTDQAQVQSFWDPTSKWGTIAGKVFATDYDGALAGLHTSLTSYVDVGGSTLAPNSFTEVEAGIAMLRLANAKIPKSELSWILPAEAFYKGYGIKPELTTAYATGLPKSVLTTNFRLPIFGVPAYESVLLKTVDNAKIGLLLHKQCLGIAWQEDNEYKLADRTPALILSKVAVSQSLYGDAVIRADHGIRIFVRADGG